MLLSLLTTTPARAVDTETLELVAKATDLFKFAPFVEWPTPEAEFPGNVFVICIIGRDPFGALLNRVVARQTVEGHSILIRRYEVITGDPGCSVAYVTGSASQSEREMLAVLASAPVLTVTDAAYSPRAPGIIDFVLQDGHVRFSVDVGEAAQQGLHLSSKLLILAVSVRTGQP